MSINKLLFIPGPVNVEKDVLEKMSVSMIGHRTNEASILQKNIHDKMQKLLFTKNRILLSTSSGSGFMEGAIRSCTKKKAAIFSIGAFGDRWYNMAISNNIPADKFSAKLGEPTLAEDVERIISSNNYDVVTITHNETSVGIQNPIIEISEVIKKYPNIIFLVDAVSSAGGSKIEVDKLGIDVLITSTQKALGLPPGMSICSFSNKAYEKAKNIQYRGLYFDMVEIYETIEKKNYQYPSTPAISLMYALNYQLDKIMIEGIENRFSRHIEMARFTRSWAKKYFNLFVKEEYCSNTLTTIENTRNINVKKLNNSLELRGLSISNGYGDLKEKTFRIAHMADMTIKELRNLFFEIEDLLNL